MKKKLWEIVKTALGDVENKSARSIQHYVIRYLYNNNVNITCCLACHVSTIRRWTNRDEILDMSRAGRQMIYSQSTRLSVVGFYCQTKPFSECDRWTLRFAERYLGQHSDVTGTAISKSTIHRIPQANNLKPHRSTYFLHISDSDFFQKWTIWSSFI